MIFALVYFNVTGWGARW